MKKTIFAVSSAIATSFALLVAATAATSLAPLSVAHADETLKEKAENKAGDVQTDAKKDHRAVKRHARKAVGTDNVGKDAKDAANDAGDDISNTAKKVKRKAD